MSEISYDAELYSRQLYTIGATAMNKLVTGKVILCGSGFDEIIKCLTLSGMTDITIIDFGNLDFKMNCDVIIFKNIKPSELIEANKHYRKSSKFILCNNGYIFCDFGNHVVIDIDGEKPKTGIINIASTNKEVTRCQSVEHHDLSIGDEIDICDKIYDVIDVISPTEFTIKSDIDCSGKNFIEKKKTVTLEFKSLEYFNFTEISAQSYPCESILGALCSQEVIKAITGKYMPIYQIWKLDLAIIKHPVVYDSHIFVIGAGAIGCEHLKNFSNMGIKKITITDSDLINKSNLSRQYLYTMDDIGKFKSIVAARKIKNLFPDLDITAHTLMFEDIDFDNNPVFNNEFMKSITCICNALDNIKSRIYVDDVCKKFNIPCIDCGTLGTKGSVQCIIPNLTETYNAQQDPPQKQIPVCTIKQFPYLFEHVVEYCKEMFTEIDIPNFIDFDSCIYYAYIKWRQFFDNQIKELIEKFPLNHVDDNMMKFWGTTRRFPKVIDFCPTDESHIGFIYTLSNIIADALKISKRYIKIDSYIKVLNFLKSKTISYKSSNINLIFDKDNTTHIDFVYYASVIRANNYDIQIEDKFKTQQIICNIIPAMITTTAVVSGLVGLQLYNILNNNKNINSYRNYYINLATAFIEYSEPAKC